MPSLGPPLVPVFWYICHFDLQKNKERTFGTKHRLLEVELGQEHFCPPVEQFRQGNFPPRGGNHRHHHHQQLSHLGEGNLHQHLHQHQLISNTSPSLVFNLVTRTIDWCLRVTSSVVTGEMTPTGPRGIPFATLAGAGLWKGRD